jgi:hypothetical protein
MSTAPPVGRFGGWVQVTDPTTGVAHIVPAYDSREHFFMCCACGAELNEAGDIIHISVDGREDFERGIRVPS